MTIDFKIDSKAPANLQQALDRIHLTVGLSDSCKRDYVSALKRIARMLGRAPADVPAGMSQLRSLVNGLHHVQAGITKKSLANVRSTLVAALRVANGLSAAGNSKPEMSSAWTTLFSKIETAWHRYTLARLARFCTTLGYSPAQVNDEVMQRLEYMLREEFTLKDPAEIRKEIAQTWNCVIARHELDLTKISVPSSAGYQTLPLSAYPPSFQIEVNHWIERLTTSDLLSEDGPTKPIAPISARNTISAIRQSAMALLQQGVSTSEFTSLAILAQPANFKRILLFFIERNDRKAPSWLGPTIAAQLLSIARYHARLPEAQLAELKRLKSLVTHKDIGMTQKNRARLRQFDNELNVYRLVLLPREIMARASKEATPSSRIARMVMLAIAIEIMLNIPLRVKTLSSIDIETDFKWVGQGKLQFIQLYIPPDRVKNREPIEVDFGLETSAMIRRYLSLYRHLLSADPGPWLFPTRKGGPRTPDHLAEDIKKLIYRETGLTMNAHLFRAFALELQDREMPGQYEAGRLLLGHKRSKTTLRFYAQRKGKRAAAAYQSTVLAKWKNAK